jgi:hypothetical protein
MGDKSEDYAHMQLNASGPSLATLESSSSSVAKMKPASDAASSFLGPRELACLSAGLSSLYAMLLVAVYIAFAFTEQVIFPKHQDFLERTGFFVFLYAGSDLFLAYVLFFAFRANPDLVTENCKVSLTQTEAIVSSSRAETFTSNFAFMLQNNYCNS